MNDTLDEIDDDLSDDDVTIDPDHVLARLTGPRDLPTVPTAQPMLQILFRSVIDRDDRVLTDFADYVLGRMSDVFGMQAAKGGQFAQDRQKDKDAGKQLRDPADYSADQTMRAHILNGVLPALRIARQMAAWGAPRLRHWTDETERLFIAGYVLHDYTKLQAVKDEFEAEGFGTYTTPNPEKLPLILGLFRAHSVALGLDEFLLPVGGIDRLLHDVVYVAHNTQRYKETLRLPALLPDKATDNDVYELATDVSTLADLIAYVARTPRDLVAHNTVSNKLADLSRDIDNPNPQWARLTYHHVAENRGVLLNFIHEATLAAMTDDLRLPLLFAPSGVVYLERYDAPSLPPLDALIDRIVNTIRDKAGDRLVETGKGAKVSKDGLRVDDSYGDYLDLRRFVVNSYKLAMKVRNNAPQYIGKMQTLGFPHTVVLPAYSQDKTDTRLRRLAEWASLVEIQIEERYPAFMMTFLEMTLTAWGLADLRFDFMEVRDHKPTREGTGIRYYWFWAALHALERQPLGDDQVYEGLMTLSEALAAALPAELPAAAQIDPTKWDDLADYLGRVLTLGGVRGQALNAYDEVARYSTSKKPRGGGAVCAMCGDVYTVTQSKETVIAFQPGVYTGRVKVGSPGNARSLCSICGLEQLLRQLNVSNLDQGGAVEGQRVRYLSFYPSYFFTTETLAVVRQLYTFINDLRISDRDLMPVLRDADFTDGSSALWMRLSPFMVSPTGEQSKRVIRTSASVGGTFYMLGLRNFDPKTDIESWIMPMFMGLVTSLNLDLKVVISEGSVPLITEASELPETIWLDGVHPAIRAVIDIGRENTSDRLHVDEVVPALCRLVAAYMIHIDTEYDPPDENWRRFAPIAHSLAESSMYVFHYLLKQEREESEKKPLSESRVRRYLGYQRALDDYLIRHLRDPKLAPITEEPLMTITRDLVDTYRRFYRAKNIKNSNSILRPINVLADALLSASAIPEYRDKEMLIEIANGELFKFMDRVGKRLADGHFPKGITVEQRAEAMRAFCDLFVNRLFIGVYKADAAALRGKPINLLKNACEVVYRQAQYAEWEERGREADDAAEDDNGDTDGS